MTLFLSVRFKFNLRRYNQVAPKMPDCFDERTWMLINAEPRNVPIKDLCPHFFAFGARINRLLRDEELEDALMKVGPARCCPPG
jgi:hypothetical protein